ncbi:MAG: 3'(2'),5'-bisphosphate nucleotidase CysQ [Rhodomicrobiaceae bacterium]
MQDEELSELARALVHTGRSAGELILRYRDAGSEVHYKPDGSPVTNADRAAEELILNDLARLAPGVSVVAEESVGAIGEGFDPAMPFFLVDPLDGTRDFVRGGKDFTVNIALIEDRTPVLGLIYAPAANRLYLTLSREEAVAADLEPLGGPSSGEPAFTPIRTRLPDAERLTVLASRSNLNEKTAQFINRLNVGETQQFSSSLKFCLLAEGRADLYPRLAPTCEWDTAAGQAILCAAGGAVLNEEGEPLTYGHANRAFVNPGFLAWGRRISALDSGPAKV